MAQRDVRITVVGNLVANPELKYTQNGTAVANFRIASALRVHRDGQWAGGEGMFFTCSLQCEAAENAVESLSKDIHVVIQGRLRQYSYETHESERRTVFKVEVDEVGLSLKFARTQITYTPRNSGENSGGGNRGQDGNAGGGFGGGFGRNQGSQGGQSDRGFGGGTPAEDPWDPAPPADGGFGDDEPPF